MMKWQEPEFSEIRSQVRKILQHELAPYVEICEEKGEFCKGALKKLGQMGFAAPMLSAPYGTGSLTAQLVVAEEMGRVCSGFGLSALASVGLFGANVARNGTEEQRKKYLPGIVSGDKIGCWALTEPDIGSDALSIKTRCHREGDFYVVSGAKTFITNAPIADYFFVMAREGDSKLSPQGFPSIEGGVALVLERGMPGLKTGNPLKKHGHLSSPTGEIFMDQVRVPLSQVVGHPGRAFFEMKESLDIERVIFSGLGLGMMDFCLETMVQYGSSRQQFGQKILDYQFYQEKVANAASCYEILQSYIFQLASRLENREMITKEAAMAKLMLARGAYQTAFDAVQCLGGNGYMREYQVERVLRDARLFEIGGGTSEIQKLIVAKAVIREREKGKGSQK